MSRSEAIKSMGQEPNSFKKTPLSQHPTDSYYEAGFQIFYAGDEPLVDEIELSRDCGFTSTIKGTNILDLPVKLALEELELATGTKPVTEDNGYSYEIEELGIWLWRSSNENEDESFFQTIGIRKI